MSLKFYLPIALVALSACGGGTTAGTGVSYAQMGQEFLRLNNARNGLASTPEANIPTTGSATYSGIYGASLSGGAIKTVVPVTGQVDLNVNFGAGTVGSVVTNLQGPVGTPVSGNVALAIKPLGGAPGLYTGGVSGNLSVGAPGHPQGANANFDNDIVGVTEGATGSYIALTGAGNTQDGTRIVHTIITERQ